jgi:hypothetical protein
MWALLKTKLKGWKTVIVDAIVGLPAPLLFLYEQFQGVDVTPLIPEKYAAAVPGMTVLGVMLRIITTGPIGRKGDQDAAPAAKVGG